MLQYNAVHHMAIFCGVLHIQLLLRCENVCDIDIACLLLQSGNNIEILPSPIQGIA